ncbi:type II secretion system protein [Clostridium sp. D53t1_180928_C8]|uniref:type II secretion system protein n=1 Tax=Clostridium sp. D53t1_180928_C8 TaxID=2787101 RepID=UPI0018A947B2|nr:type II secretion system protein [Clostridium sp. D53t1_180928_C8]
MKKGYTLIEVILVLAIITILILPTLNIAKSYKDITSRIKGKGIMTEISNLISYSKYYCKHNESYGEIEINNNEGKIIFKDTSEKGTVVKSISLQDGFKFTSNNRLDINKLGHIKSDTIRIIDKDGNVYRVTIATGIDTVNAYEGE